MGEKFGIGYQIAKYQREKEARAAEAASEAAEEIRMDPHEEIMTGPSAIVPPPAADPSVGQAMLMMAQILQELRGAKTDEAKDLALKQAEYLEKLLNKTIPEEGRASGNRSGLLAS